jgi:hypothetical protein
LSQAVGQLIAVPPLPHATVTSLCIGEVALDLLDAINPLEFNVIPDPP